MMHNELRLQKLLLGLALLAACVSIVASSTSRERRHVGVGESSHRPGRIHTPGSRSFKSSTSKNNAITAEPGRKVSHRLIGGHLRAADTKQGRNEAALWDDGILMSSAGNGKENRNTRGDEDDEKKTLSQQVKEGKYGLIQNEIYGNRPKRPGIISYLNNPEVPKDTVDNLGGLDEDEIWLAENHVLVLRGGKFPDHEADQGSGNGGSPWSPIDDYKAPRRQIKIPSRPKVPPPFPVQLTEGGPVQIILPNGTKEVANDTDLFGKDSPYAKGLLPGDGALFAIIANGTLLTPGLESPRNVTEERKSINRNQNDKRRKSDPTTPSNLPPFYHAIPPGAVFVPPPPPPGANQSDYDEEDQSIYYPPPYSFFYQQDNTTAVPPGPLVPGIILPPPPDFFSALEDKKTTTKKYVKHSRPTPPPRSRPTYLPPRKLTTKQYRISTTVAPMETRTNMALSVSTKMYSRMRYKNSTRTPLRNTPKTVTYMETTTPTSDKPTTRVSTEFDNIASVTGNQVSEGTQEKSRTWSELVTSKTLPIVAYYPTTTQSSLERPVEVTPASITNVLTTSSPERSPNRASYYFYEESSEDNAGTTSTPSALYYSTTTETPYFRVETESRPEERKKQYYSEESIPPQRTAKDYDVKFIDSIVKNSQPFRYRDPEVTRTSSKYEDSSARNQGQRMLPDSESVYYHAVSRPAVAVQSYYTTPKPQTYYRQDTKPKPIYQYSFEAADYSKHGNQRHRYKQQQQSVSYDDYQDAKTTRHRYDYGDEESVRERQLRPESVPYKLQHPVYPSSTAHPFVSTTSDPHHAYYTQQDEKLLDDVTKEYFTIFGKKLPNGLPSTTPIYGKTSSVTERPDYNVNRYVQNNYNTAESPVFKTPSVKVYYGDQTQRPYSLKDDTLVNYRQPLPPINPDSEFITVAEPKPQQQQRPFQRYRLQSADYRLQFRGPASQEIVEPGNGPTTNYVPIAGSAEEIDESYQQRPLSLADDIDVNYRDPRPTINPDAEYIDPIPAQDNRPEKPKAYFAYSLPGDGGHFYFLTPQAITQRPDQNAGYLYPKSRGTRLLRRRRRPGNV